MFISVLSKKDFDDMMERHGINDNTVESSDNLFFISINNVHGMDIQSWFHHDHNNVLRLFFDDCLPEDPSSENTLFNEKHAKKIIEFIKRFNNDSQIFIHCRAGVSRSAAVGAFIAEKFNILNDEERFKHGKIFFPNFFVLKLLRKLDQG
jgi:predicted protein tyrosine phosphatase